MIINCSEETLALDKDRAIYWEAKRMLIISDIHLGKSAHFRRHGIQVPATVGLSDLDRLTALLEKYDTDRLIITGDMFHNKMNSDIDAFRAWRNNHPSLSIELIKGNHDDLNVEEYLNLNINVHAKELLSFPFRFIHDKPDKFDEYYNICGHIHPGVTIYGKARQSLKLACFYFSKTCAILPAFSVFTGLSIIRPQEEDRFFAITPNEVIAV
jgi:DNA ligase-associated metallophosphoesterase